MTRKKLSSKPTRLKPTKRPRTLYSTKTSDVLAKVFITLLFIFTISIMLLQIAFSRGKTLPAKLPNVFHKNIAQAAEIAPSIIMNGNRHIKQIALTFDADMTPWMKEQLDSGAVASYYGKQTIQVLEDTHTKATLFLTGLWIQSYPDVTRQLADNPLFELGNHTFEHFSFSGVCYGLPPLPDDQRLPSITKTDDLLRSVAGVTAKYFRFPGGCYDDADLKLVHDAGLIPIQWDVAADDGFNNNERSIVDKVISEAQNGSIIVFHMNGEPNEPQTANALPVIIQKLKEEGYSFVTISELLAEPIDYSLPTITSAPEPE